MYASKYVYRLFRLILIAITLVYFLACFWIAVVSACDYNYDDPLAKYRCFAALQPAGDPLRFYEYDNVNQLIISGYFILATLSNVGFGDFYPQSQFEKIVDIFIMLIGITFFSYIMSNFTTFLTNYDKVMGVENKSTDMQVWLNSLSFIFNKKFPQYFFKDLLTNTPISKEKIQEIYDQFEYYWKNNRLASITLKDEYMKIMPIELKKEVFF